MCTSSIKILNIKSTIALGHFDIYEMNVLTAGDLLLLFFFITKRNIFFSIIIKGIQSEGIEKKYLYRKRPQNIR